MSIVPTIVSSLEGMESAFERLRVDLRQMGLNLTLWDMSSSRVGQCQSCPLSEVLGEQCQAAESELQQLGGKVVACGQEHSAMLSCGCCAVAVPLFTRRRLVGAAAACFGVNTISQQRIELLCGESRLDKNLLMSRVEGCCRRSPRDAADVMRLLAWLLSREQTVQTATAELANLSANLATTYEELSLVYRVSSCMKVTAKPEDFMQNVCDELLDVMNIESAIGLIFAHPPIVQRDITVTAGAMDLNIDQIQLLTSTLVAPKLISSAKPVLDNHFTAPPDSGLFQAVRKLVAVPLMNESTPIGMLVGLNKRGRDFDSVDLKLISSIANQASVFLTNSQLYADLQDLLMGVLHALTATIDAKDAYTCGHSQRVAVLSRRIAQACGYIPEKVQQIYLSGLLHDIGKIGVPERVLCKEGRLTADEYELIKRHPAISAKILQGIRQLDEVIEGVVTHHERPDGKGYPRGLAGSKVPIEGLIVGLADSFDSMTSDRTYRKALQLDKVLAEIRRCAGTQFDPGLVETFLKLNFEELQRELAEHTHVGRGNDLRQVLTEKQ